MDERMIMCEKCNGEGIVLIPIAAWGVQIQQCECRREVGCEEGIN